VRARLDSRRPLLRLLAGLGVWFVLAAPVRADEAAALREEVARLEREVARLAARLRELEGRTPTPECTAAAESAEAWRDPARWRQLRKGMSRFEVMRLLGEPGKVSSYEGFERWEYPAALGARVNFDDRGRVHSWHAAGS
jgi:hypothetical protein